MTVYVTTAQASRLLGIPQTTIRWWAHTGKANRYGTPGRALYDLEELTDLHLTSPNATVPSVGVLHPENPAPSPAEEEPPVGPSHERGTT